MIYKFGLQDHTNTDPWFVEEVVLPRSDRTTYKYDTDGECRLELHMTR